MNPITREESLLDGQDLTPITRKEQFIKRIYDKTQEIPEPITREEYFLKKAGEGTSPVAVEQLNVTENGTYSETGKAYSPVTVEVPLPTNANERKTATSYPVTDSANYPLPKCDVTVTNADKCEVIVTSDNVITENNAPYVLRQSAGGSKCLDSLVGGTIAWNQLINFQNSTRESKNVTLTCTNGLLSISGVPSSAGYFGYNVKIISGHKYYGYISESIAGVSISEQTSTLTFESYFPFGASKSGIAVAVSSNDNANIGIYFTSSYDGTLRNFYYGIFDLTELFGSTIADYIYSLEQSTAGSGIAWLKSYGFLTEDYYEYQSGKLESVNVARHVMKDSNDAVIGSYPYPPIPLRGIPKLTNGELTYDGDTLEASGRVTRKYGVVDLGTLTYTLTVSSGRNIFYTESIENIKTVSTGSEVPHFISVMYRPVSNNAIWVDKDISFYATNTNRVDIVNNDYNNTTAFKTAMSGVYLVYELATPTTEYTSPFEANQIVDADGTEEYIDAGVEAGTRDVAVPVGHQSKYFNGKAYVKPLTAGTSDTVSMADLGIMPTSPMYISANGSVDVEYWKSNS